MRNKLVKKIISFIIIPILFVLLFNAHVYASDEWETLSPVGSDVTYISHYVDNGIPYIAYIERGVERLTVKKYLGGNWITIGEEDFTEQYASRPSLFVRNGTPYVAYLDEISGRQAVTVKMFVEGQGWCNVGERGLIPSSSLIYYASGVSLYVDNNGILYVAICDYNNYGGNLWAKVTVMRYAEEQFGWQILGQRGFSEGIMSSASETPSLYVDNGVPYVAYSYYIVENKYDYKDYLDVMGYNWDDKTWYHVGDMPYIPSDSSDDPCLIIDNGTLYVSFEDLGKAVVLKYNPDGSKWEQVGNIDVGDYSVEYNSLIINKGTPYIALGQVSYLEGGCATIWKYTGKEWIKIWNSTVSKYYPPEAVSLAGDINSLCLAYINTYSKSAIVMKYVEASQPTVNIAVTQGEGGYFKTPDSAYYYTPTNKFDITSGSSLSLNFYSDEGFIISTVYVDGELAATKPGTHWAYTFENAISDHTISIEYAPGYQISANITGDGTVNGTGFDSALNVGYYYNTESVVLTANADTGHSLTYWLTDNELYSSENSITINSTTSHSFDVRFDPYYTYTSSAGNGGTITPSTDVKVTWDDSSLSLYYPAKTFDITPNTGYYILDVLVDDVSVGAVGNYTFPRADLSFPLANHTISAIFAPDNEGEDDLSKIQAINSFFHEKVEAGELTGIGDTEKVAANRLKAFGNMIKEAERLIENGDYEGAILQLQSAYKKVDGNPNPPDFVEGDARAELAQMIQDLINLLESLIE